VPESTPALSQLRGATGVARSSAGLVVVGELAAAFDGGAATSAGDEFPVVVELLDMADPASWLPSIEQGNAAGAGTVLLARKAAADLGVHLGDTVQLRHGRSRADGSAEMVVSAFRIAGIHGNPLRSLVYLDASDRALFGATGLVNRVRLEPAAGVTPADLQRAAFAQPGVRAARSVGAAADQIRDGIDQYLALLRIVEAIPLVLALLAAFNAVLIGAEEHRRDHATMFAFGVTRRRVVGLLMVEALVLAVIGTATGLLAGWLLTRWIVEVVVPATLPELGITARLAPANLLGAAAIGVLTVSLAPLLLVRRLGRVDIPATLRVME
jgi:putative ABC transport system permease protein